MYNQIYCDDYSDGSRPTVLEWPPSPQSPPTWATTFNIYPSTRAQNGNNITQHFPLNINTSTHSPKPSIPTSSAFIYFSDNKHAWEKALWPWNSVLNFTNRTQTIIWMHPKLDSRYVQGIQKWETHCIVAATAATYSLTRINWRFFFPSFPSTGRELKEERRKCCVRLCDRNIRNEAWADQAVYVCVCSSVCATRGSRSGHHMHVYCVYTWAFRSLFSHASAHSFRYRTVYTLVCPSRCCLPYVFGYVLVRYVCSHTHTFKHKKYATDHPSIRVSHHIQLYLPMPLRSSFYIDHKCGMYFNCLGRHYATN